MSKCYNKYVKVKEEITREIFRMTETENTMYQHWWDAAKEALRGKCVNIWLMSDDQRFSGP